jgi:hypothetical protein
MEKSLTDHRTPSASTAPAVANIGPTVPAVNTGPTLPTIHLNGTSATTLLCDYLAITDALDAATRAIFRSEFHRRDYYPVDGSWEKASSERNAILFSLQQAHNYFDAIIAHAHKHGGKI